MLRFPVSIPTVMCTVILLLNSPALLSQIEKRVESLEQNTQTLEKGVQSNTREVRTVRERVNANAQGIQDTRKDLLDQKDSIKSIGTDIDSVAEQIQDTRNTLQETHSSIKTIEDRSGLNTNHLDRFWILICAILVFFMQAGFKALEAGMVRKEHRAGVGMKNLIDWLVVCAIFYIFGFGLMFGSSRSGIIGWDLFMPNASQMGQLNAEFKLEFFLFQLAFAGTAATIVSGAMSERSALTSYALSALFIGGFIYPLFGHWAWGGVFIEKNEPWLASLGFHDFAGATVVHSIGAWVALAAIYVLGPRKGRFDPAKKSQFKPSDLGYSVLGVFILWFGWWGFNGGSTLGYNDDVSYVILNTNLAAAFAGISAFSHAYFADRDQTFVKFIGGVLGGLVAITACCDVVAPGYAIVVGIVAGIVHNYSFDLLIRLKLDDPVGAIPVHGFCGAWGTISVGLMGIQDRFSDGVFPAGSRGQQILMQLFGITVAFVFAAGVAFLLFLLIDSIIGLRVAPDQEENGFTIKADRRALRSKT